METIQWLTMLICFLCLIIVIDIYKKKKWPSLYLIPLLVYLISVLMFYAARMLELHVPFLGIPDEIHFFSTWSSILRLQEVLTILSYLVILGDYDGKWRKYVRAKWMLLSNSLKD